jgi:hypothetical protein
MGSIFDASFFDFQDQAQIHKFALCDGLSSLSILSTLHVIPLHLPSFAPNALDRTQVEDMAAEQCTSTS